MTRGHFPEYWPEQAERDERYRSDVHERRGLSAAVSGIVPAEVVPRASAWRLPSWDQLEREAVAVRRHLCTTKQGRDAWELLYGRGNKTIGTIGVPSPETFTITNPQHFQLLPSIDERKEAAVRAGLRFANAMISPAISASAVLMRHDAPQMLSPEKIEEIGAVIRAEQAHMLYHRALWQQHGRRVAVLDRFTYELLGATELPPFPAKILSMPWQSLYLVLPPKAFAFEVQDARTGSIDKRFAEGIMLALDHPEPEYDGPRELSFMVLGEDEGYRSEGRNSAFATVRFGPDALLTEFDLDAVQPTNPEQLAAGLYYGQHGFIGSQELNVVVPRVLVGLLLYLASEHPDVIPIPPPPRKNFAEIRSPKQRASALANQADKLRGATRLPVLVIGSRLRDEVDRQTAERQAADAESGKKWTLDHAVPVRGHWRQQPYGKNRELRRPVWIRPFWRGPDAAESLVIRAARVPKARPNPVPNILTRSIP